MNEVRTALRRMAFYYLLLALNIIPNASIIPDVFPTRNVSAIYLLTLAVCLVFYYSHRISTAGSLSLMMRSFSWMALLLILLRGIKYSVFAEVDILARHTWYLYYVPMLLLPLFLFYVSLLVSSDEGSRISRGWYWTAALTVFFIASVLTNDLHQQVFGFHPGFAGWDSDYSHGWLFYAVTAWQYLLYIAAIVVLVIKCRISSSKKHAWIILIPFLIGSAMNVLLITGRMPKLNGSNLIEFPEALIFMAAVVLECCMQLGLIPTNTDYGRLFQNFSISAQITDKAGKPVYSSYTSAPLSKQEFTLPDNSRIGEHTVLHRMELPGGFGFWQDDITELDRLNAELAEAKEELSQESELIRLRSELKEREAKIAQRTLVYDTIAKRTQRQSQSISQIAKEARLSSDPEFKERCRNRITFLGAYIKRYANLTLMAQEDRFLPCGELGLSVSEVLRYLNFCGIPGEIIVLSRCSVPADAAVIVFEAFETLLDTSFSSLRGSFVNLSERGDKLLFKLAVEAPAVSLPGELRDRLSAAGVTSELQYEDDITYVCFALPKGGEAA